jgi:AcrR family transcriptional regulator
MRERLVAAAIRILEEGEGTPSLRAVAQAAGVSAMAPYRHFPDKAALIGAVAAYGFDALRGVLLAADRIGTEDAAEAVIAQGLAYVDFALDHPALFRLMFTDPRLARMPKDSGPGAYGVLADRVAGIAGSRAEEAALGCWAIVHGLAMLVLDGRTEHAPARMRAVLTLFVATWR